jgi:hypothetical protein
LISNLLPLRQPAQLRLDRPIDHCEQVGIGHQRAAAAPRWSSGMTTP